MERLTMRNSDGTYSQPTHLTFEKMFYKLAEFEDFMEENEWDSIEEMKSALNQCEQKYFKMQRDYEELKHCIWKDTPIEQIRNNYERSHNFDFVGVAYNRGKAKIDRKVRQENQALKDRWNILKDWISNSNEVLLYSITDKPAKIGNKRYNYFERKQLLDKMKELEQEKI